MSTSAAGALGCLLLFLTGCSSAPSRNILGSYFPSWMICALIGMGATVALRVALVKVGIDGHFARHLAFMARVGGALR
jgi:hypothetical protein